MRLALPTTSQAVLPSSISSHPSEFRPPLRRISVASVMKPRAAIRPCNRSTPRVHATHPSVDTGSIFTMSTPRPAAASRTTVTPPPRSCCSPRPYPSPLQLIASACARWSPQPAARLPCATLLPGHSPQKNRRARSHVPGSSIPKPTARSGTPHPAMGSSECRSGLW